LEDGGMGEMAMSLLSFERGVPALLLRSSPDIISEVEDPKIVYIHVIIMIKSQGLAIKI
jgi:hypothetical protein